WRSARRAIPSTRASRSWSTPEVGLSASSVAPRSGPGPGSNTLSPGGGLAQAGSGAGSDGTRMPDGALVAKRDAPVGGQAVLEGVMMRGVSVWAVAVRKPEGDIE